MAGTPEADGLASALMEVNLNSDPSDKNRGAAEIDQGGSGEEASKKIRLMEPGTDWKPTPFNRSRRWSNPDEWNFKILLKWGNFRPQNGFKMASKLFGSGPSDITEPFKDFSLLKDFQSGQNRLQILWIGHATLLVQIGGRNILTDPVFSDVAGPNKRMGYTRFRKPAVTIQQLKGSNIEIHAVIISHNHYDHLDERSIRDLNEEYKSIKWFVPMDVKTTMETWGCPDKHVTELNWWDKREVDSLTFCFTPAKHWSGRGTFDWYKSLWGSWIIQTKDLTFFFAGDTGYQEELFAAIKQEFPSIDVAALPIGAYEPREMVKCQHINPEEAVKIHKDLGIKMSVGIHWGTFQLTTETMQQTKEDLKKALEDYNVTESAFQTLEDSLTTTYSKTTAGPFSTD